MSKNINVYLILAVMLFVVGFISSGVRETPISPMARRIGIEAGHAGSDSGALSCDQKYKEVDNNIAVANLAADTLRKRGYIVDVFNSSDSRMKGYVADAFVALHNDWCATGQTGFKVSRYGGQPVVGTNGTGDGSDRLVQAVWSNYASTTGLGKDSGSGHFTNGMLYYYALNSGSGWISAQTPGVIIEMGWWSGDADMLLNHRDTLANGVVNSLLAFLGDSTSSSSIVVEEPTLSPATGGNDTCTSAWYRFANNRGYYAYLTVNVNSTAQSTNRAEWRPYFVKGGLYKVEAYIANRGAIAWPCFASHPTFGDTSDAHYVINYANGSATVTGNQLPLADQWLDLGSYIFNVGNNGSVKLSDLNDETNWSRYVSFSAMRFSCIGGDCSSINPTPTPTPTLNPTPTPTPPSTTCNVPLTPNFTEAYNNVTFNNQAASVGTVVEAYDPRGNEVGCFVVKTAGQYGLMRIYGEDVSVTPNLPGMRDGEAVIFKVNGQLASATPVLVWRNDKSTQKIDLAAPSTLKQPLTLQSGWNLVSSYIEPPNPAVAQVLAALSGRYSRVLGEGTTYVPTLADSFNTLKELHAGKGYYIYLNSTPMTINLEGSNIAATTPIALHSGWNWLGYLPTSNLPVATALQSINGTYQRVLSLDKTYSPSLPTFSTLKEMTPGQGYLIYMNNAATLTYPSNTITLFSAKSGGISPTSGGGCPAVQTSPTRTDVYGYIKVNGQLAPLGTIVEARDPRGITVGCYTIDTAGQYGIMPVYGEDTTITPTIPGMRAAEPLTFYVNGVLATPSPLVNWGDLAQEQVDLTVTTAEALSQRIYLPLVVK